MSENDIAKDILDTDGKQVILTRSSKVRKVLKIALRSLRFKYLRRRGEPANQQGCG